jgi:predicted nucleic acid-binding protein
MVLDSSGWLEHFKRGPRAGAFEPYVRAPSVLVPTIVLYEVYKVLMRDDSEAAADRAAAMLHERPLIPLTSTLAVRASIVSLTHRLSMADAIVYATAQAHDALLVTGDEHFKELPGVRYLGP